MHKILFYNKFIISLTCFEHYVLIIRTSNCIIQHLVSSHSVGGRPVRRLREESSLNLRTERPPTECDDTRCCIIQFDLVMMSTTGLLLDFCYLQTIRNRVSHHWTNCMVQILS